MIKKRLILSIITIIIALSSCVSLSTPKKAKRASRKLGRHLTGIDRIVKVYPELMDSLTVTKYDTIVIKEHTVDTSFTFITDTAFIDKVLYNFLSEDSIVTVEKIKYIRNLIIKQVIKDTTYVYEDSLLKFTLIVQDGKFYAKPTLKRKRVSYVVQETSLNPKLIKQPAWKNSWFWVLIAIILGLLYLLRGRV